MSRDMNRHDSCLDVSDFDQADPDVPRLRPRRFNGPDNALLFPSLHSVHRERCLVESTHLPGLLSMELEPNMGVELDICQIRLGYAKHCSLFRPSLMLLPSIVDAST